MRIQEVEALVGITRKNLRFYEQQGLLHPGRSDGNGYRDYSEADVHTLQQILLLRQLGIPLEEIRQLQAGALTVGDAMARQSVSIRREISNLELRDRMCREMADLDLPLSQLDPAPYLTEMEEYKQKGALFVDTKHDIRKQIAAPVAAAVVMILLMAAVLAMLIWAELEDPLPLVLWLVIALLPAAVAVGVVAALVSRIRELRDGEAEAARKF